MTPKPPKPEAPARRTLGAGSWHAFGFRLDDDVHYPHRDRGGRVRVLDNGIVVTRDEDGR